MDLLRTTAATWECTESNNTTERERERERERESTINLLFRIEKYIVNSIMFYSLTKLDINLHKISLFIYNSIVMSEDLKLGYDQEVPIS